MARERADALAGADADVDAAEAPRPAGSRLRRRAARVLRRVPGRTIMLIGFGMALAAVLLATFPFSTTSDKGTPLDCGPPLYEVVVPPDPAFDVPENAGCATPARQRVLFAGILFGAALVGTAVTQLIERRETRYHHSRWLTGPRPSRRARKQRERQLEQQRELALDRMRLDQGSTPARSIDRNSSAAR